MTTTNESQIDEIEVDVDDLENEIARVEEDLEGNDDAGEDAGWLCLRC